MNERDVTNTKNIIIGIIEESLPPKGFKRLFTYTCDSYIAEELLKQEFPLDGYAIQLTKVKIKHQPQGTQTLKVKCNTKT